MNEQSNLIYSISIFCAFLLSLILISFIKKIYYYVKYKKRFFILPRVSIKGIANISMVIAISIAIIILLTIATADLFNVVFRAWPGTRVTIEGLLIKIGGLLFGPFLGLFIGAMTDLLTVALTAGVFHYGYLIAAMAYGLISGFISDIFRSTKDKIWWKAVLGTLILTACNIIMVLFFMLQTNSFQNNFSVSLFGNKLDVNVKILLIVLVTFICLGILIIWIVYFLNFNKQHHKHNSIITETKAAKKNDLYSSIIIVLVVSVMCNSIINMLILPSFDAQLSSIRYEEWVVLRSIVFIPEVIFNCCVIIPIYNIVVPIINYNYHDDLLEDIKYPLYVE